MRTWRNLGGRANCFLGPFLESGKTPNGEVPDIVFEQLPFDHPVSVAFTSGTTGLPKGAVHSAGSLLGPLMHFALHYNLKSGDVVHTIYPNGWTLWNYHVPCLSLGIKLLLENGTVYRLKDGSNLWDVLSKYKVAYSFIVTSIVDKLEKMKACPESEIITMGRTYLLKNSSGRSPLTDEKMPCFLRYDWSRPINAEGGRTPVRGSNGAGPTKEH
ncbi:acetoacetyl-CoA synthetase [Trichonephila clavipes]|nr:acetoacetyl-CoA synthetase [Trichonephila clavipes]